METNDLCKINGPGGKYTVLRQKYTVLGRKYTIPFLKKYRMKIYGLLGENTVLKKLYASSEKSLYNFMSYNNLKYMIFDKISIAPTYLLLGVSPVEN